MEARSDGPDQGSEFVVRLPRVNVAGAESLPEQEDRHVAGTLQILVVDDNVDAASTLSLLLEVGGHQVATEHDASSALGRLHQERPDMLLLDIGLPDMDGYELARRVRALPGMDKAVLVAVTGYGQSQDRDKAKAAGFDHHLTKPASMEQLQHVLRQVVGSRA